MSCASPGHEVYFDYLSCGETHRAEMTHVCVVQTGGTETQHCLHHNATSSMSRHIPNDYKMKSMGDSQQASKVQTNMAISC